MDYLWRESHLYQTHHRNALPGLIKTGNSDKSNTDQSINTRIKTVVFLIPIAWLLNQFEISRQTPSRLTMDS
jgi:hypothetical protein